MSLQIEKQYAEDSFVRYDLKFLDAKGFSWLVGWGYYAPVLVPVFYIMPDAEAYGYKFDKQEFAQKVKTKWPNTNGTYFLVSELVQIKKEEGKTE
jgi:hypothetical protein